MVCGYHFRLLGKYKLEDICSHFESFQSYFWWIIVYCFIFSAIPQIRLVTIKADQPSLVDESKSLRGFPIMLVNFGKSVVECVFLVVNRMIKRKFDEV